MFSKISGMKSNYKKLKDFIVEKVEFNEGNKYSLLQGVSNKKYFQKAKTNIIDVDLSKYRVAHYNQFVFNRATTRNGEKISIALRKGKSCMVSPSYRIFEVVDENILHPDYLMMWFTRPEFDRYARFKSHGSAHEFFDMDEMRDIELPIPSLKKQKELIEEYQAIENRIQLNKELCATLEETAQTLYKHWFEDFEFPDENGKPYKSSGGEMVECEELGKEIPKGWRGGKLEELLIICYGKSYSKLSAGSIPMYGSGGIMSYVNESLYDSETVLIPRKGSLNNIMFINTPFWSVDTMFYSKQKIENVIPYAFQFLKKHNFSNSDQGSAVPSMTTSFLNDMQILIPDFENLKEYKSIFSTLFESIEMKNSQTQILEELKSLLLGKMAVEV